MLKKAHIRFLDSMAWSEPEKWICAFDSCNHNQETSYHHDASSEVFDFLNLKILL
jgi:hypothetical protein